VQLDDLDTAGLARVGEAAFLTLQTSPGNHQAWVAVSDLADAEGAKDFAGRLREGAGNGKVGPFSWVHPALQLPWHLHGVLKCLEFRVTIRGWKHWNPPKK